MTARYSRSLRVIHCLTAALVAGQLLLALLNSLVYEAQPVLAEWLVQSHISLGAVILAVTVVRFAARRRSSVPPRPVRTTLRQTAAAVHGLLYLCLLALPITGYLKLAALGFSVKLFGFVPLPALPMNIALAQHADILHNGLALTLGGLLAVHVCAAVFHKRIDGKDVLAHMSFGNAGAASQVNDVQSPDFRAM